FTGTADIFSLCHLCMPTNLGHSHWVLAAIDFTGEQLVILDTMAAGQSYETVFNLLAGIVHHEAANRFAAADDSSTASWARLASRGLEVSQRDGGDNCGAFTIMFACCLSRGEPLTFSMKHVQFLRRR
ncbi:unnamed protein product, partial [Phaeothamnion confervicola]